MRIKELQLYGFKSFPHKSIVRLSTGLNAIIGPNGCGKSNILDALRWVLGEQSFSLLRCTKNDDLIFGGTAHIPALGYSEVRLILENNEEIPGFGSEIEVRRRYFRSGESEFFLNRNPCRLKDIQDIFYNTGTGTKAYSIFDLRSLRAIIGGELRPMFEEAATLAKYRERRTDCLRKLELTDADLLRLNDIVTERERVTRSLKRQAYRLTAYDRLRNEERRLQLLLLKKQFDDAVAAEQTAAQDLATREESDARQLDAIQKLEAALEELRRALASARAERERLLAETEELRAHLGRNESLRTVAARDLDRFVQEQAQLDAESTMRDAESTKARVNLEKGQTRLADLSRQTGGFETDLDAVRSGTREQEVRLLELRQSLNREKESGREALARRVELQRANLSFEAQIANTDDYRARVATELAELEERLGKFNAELETSNAELEIAAANLEQARARLSEQRNRQIAIRARLDDLASLEHTLNESLLAASQDLAILQPALGRQQRETAAAKLGPAFLGGLSEFLTVKEGYEPAVEAALTGLLGDFVVQAAGESALTSHSSLLTSLLSGLDRNQRWGLVVSSPSVESREFLVQGSGCATLRSEFSELETQDSKLPPVPPCLLDHVELKPGAPELLRQILGGATLVDSFEAAWNEYASSPRHPTPDTRHSASGSHIWVTRDGVALFADGVIVLESAREGKLTVERRARELEKQIADLQTQLADGQTEAGQLNPELTALGSAIETADSALVELINVRSKIDAQRASLSARALEVLQDVNRQRAEVSNVASRRAELQKQLDASRAQLNEHESGIQHSESEVTRLEGEIGLLEQTVRTGLQDASQVLLKLTRVREQMRSEEREIEIHRGELAQAAARQAEIAQRRQGLITDRAARQAQIGQLAADDVTVRATLDERMTRLNTLDLTALAGREDGLMREMHKSRQAQEAARQRTLELKLHSMETVHRREALEQEAQRTYQTELADFTAAPEPEVENKLRLISERLERLGRVNPLAGDEYTKEKVELERLTTQRADVLAAKDNLLKTIAEMDRFAREQFVSTFNTVRESFREIFARLFVEGEADLILETPSAPLESEITIIAKPKGKSPKRLDQLSDGEKALLALSLLFAFYRVKPAPFCFLDEVDAPLDDANVDRFALFLKELSQKTQVIIITHNRATVEQADTLFGVTTEEPGVSKIVSVKLADFDKARRRLIEPVME